MLISHTHSFIFFHVAKVAGTSIRHVLEPYTQEPEHFKIKRPVKTINGEPNPVYQMWDSMINHATVKQTQRQFPEECARYQTFAFVRNPWDWHVSMYHFLLKQTENPHYPAIKQAGSFRHYMDWVVTENKPYPKGATRLQKTMLVDENNQIAVDHIGRYENLAEDFKKITEQIGIEASLPALNRSSHKKYQDYYDSYTEKLVAKHFAEDIDAFEYTFK